MGNDLGIFELITEHLAQGRPGRPEEKQRDQQNSHLENHPKPTLFSTGGLFSNTSPALTRLAPASGRLCRWPRIGGHSHRT